MDMRPWNPALTRPLSDLTSADLAIAGGKGASLGAMLQADLPVPKGFVVLTEAYWSFVRCNGFAEPVRALAKNVAADEAMTLAAVAQALKDRFIAGENPAEVARSIADETAPNGKRQTLHLSRAEVCPDGPSHLSLRRMVEIAGIPKTMVLWENTLL